MIRQATPQDIDAIADILQQSVPLMQAAGNRQWDGEYPNRRRFLDDIAAGTLYVTEAEGAVAGFVCANTELPPEYDAVPWQTSGAAMALHRMAVSPQFRGRGLALELVRSCETLGKAQGFDCIHTDTNSKNAPVNALLNKLGYRFCGTITLRDNLDLFHCYEKQL